MPLNLKDVD